MKNKKGFSLIELLITLAILGILLIIAFPSYQRHVTKSHRAEAQTALLDLAARMERYYTEHHSYTGTTINALAAKRETENGFYSLTISAAKQQSFEVQAVPMGVQSKNDTQCGVLTMNQLGEKGQTGTGTSKDCW